VKRKSPIFFVCFFFLAGGFGLFGGPLVALIAAGGGAVVGTAVGTAGSYLRRRKLQVPKLKVKPVVASATDDDHPRDKSVDIDLRAIGSNFGILDLRINENEAFALVCYDEDTATQYLVEKEPHKMLGHLYTTMSDSAHNWANGDPNDDDIDGHNGDFSLKSNFAF